MKKKDPTAMIKLLEESHLTEFPGPYIDLQSVGNENLVHELCPCHCSGSQSHHHVKEEIVNQR